MRRKKAENHWMSISDIMTGLMVIFMFIAISYIMEAQNKQAERDEIFEEFKATKEELYNELDSTFKDDFKRWEVELGRDLSIKFTNPEILFAPARSSLKPEFRKILWEFFPKYLDIVLQEKYKEKISEIRIEGHTDSIPHYSDPDPYIGNVMLSQERATRVFSFLRRHPYYQTLSSQNEERLRFWLTANGLSYGRTLDSGKKLTYLTSQPINNKFSRRVEFRIITTSEKLVDKVIQEIENQ